MSYIGRGLDAISNVEKLDNITFDGSATYALEKSSVAYTPSGANNILISIDGVVQMGNFSVSTTNIVFDWSPTSSNTCDWILHYGTGLVNTLGDQVITSANMGANSVDSASYVDGSIDNEHLADDAVGVAELSATGTASSSTFLRGDNAWVAAGGAWTHIVTKTASSSALIDFVDGASGVVFDNTYNFYVVIGQSIVSANNNVELDMFSTNDGTNYETLYDYVEIRGLQGGSSPVILTTTADFGHVGSFGNASGKCGAFVLNLPNPSTSGTYHTAFGTAVVNDDGGNVRTSMFSAQHETAEAYTGIKFAMTSGNIASGTFSLYGVTT